MQPYQIDIDREELMPLSKCAQTMPGRRVNTATTWRWSTKGIRGIKLPTVLIGGIRHTSREARAWWVAATTAVADGQTSAPITPKHREDAIAKAERELAAI